MAQIACAYKLIQIVVKPEFQGEMAQKRPFLIIIVEITSKSAQAPKFKGNTRQIINVYEKAVFSEDPDQAASKEAV